MQTNADFKSNAERMRALSDITDKAIGDLMRALDTSMDLANDIAGASGLFAVSAKVSSALIMGTAICYAAMRDGGKGKEAQEDDVLFCALITATMNQKNATGENGIRLAQAMFEKIKGYQAKIPNAWREQ